LVDSRRLYYNITFKPEKIYNINILYLKLHVNTPNLTIKGSYLINKLQRVAISEKLRLSGIHNYEFEEFHPIL